jgi:hypothetical protein
MAPAWGQAAAQEEGGGGVTTTPYVLVGTKEGTEPVGQCRSTQMKKPNVRVTGAEWASP